MYKLHVYKIHVTFHGKTSHCADNRFLAKATTTKYNPCTIAPANLKSLARVVMEMSQNVPGLPILNMCSEHDETFLGMLHAEVCILVVYASIAF